MRPPSSSQTPIRSPHVRAAFAGCICSPRGSTCSLFDAALARMWETTAVSGSCLGLMMVDVDNFKAFNDAAGHQAGDPLPQLLPPPCGLTFGWVWTPLPDMAAKSLSRSFPTPIPPMCNHWGASPKRRGGSQNPPPASRILCVDSKRRRCLHAGVRGSAAR